MMLPYNASMDSIHKRNAIYRILGVHATPDDTPNCPLTCIHVHDKAFKHMTLYMF